VVEPQGGNVWAGLASCAKRLNSSAAHPVCVEQLKAKCVRPGRPGGDELRAFNVRHAPLKQYPLYEQSLSHASREQSNPIHPRSHMHVTFLPHEPWPEQIFCGTSSDPGHTLMKQSLPTKPG
jgi:hypothetical protein